MHLIYLCIYVKQGIFKFKLTFDRLDPHYIHKFDFGPYLV